MNIILTSALSGIILLFSGFYLKNSRALSGLAIALLTVIFVSGIFQLSGCGVFLDRYQNMIKLSDYGITFFLVIVFATILYFLLNHDNFGKVGNHVAEYFALIFFSITGIAVLAVFNNMVMYFLGIELLSIPIYILAGTAKDKIESTEASVKYFLMGAFSTGMMLLGITLIYGATGTFAVEGLWNYIPEFTSVYYLGWVMLFFSLCFKVSAAPFHFWTPDVYDGTPTVFTSYMSTIVKGGAFLAFIGIMSHFPFNAEYADFYKYLLGFIIILTLLIGNITALAQGSVKRMMAYSSIAQAGFMMFVLYRVQAPAKEALIYYTLSYSLANFIIFYALTQVKDYSFKAFNGLGEKSPLLAFSTAVALISLAGIPLTSGFIAKFMALSIGADDPFNLPIIIGGLVLAVLSVYYYFKVIVAMYFKPVSYTSQTFQLNSLVVFSLIACVILIVLLGIFPSLLFQIGKSPMW